MQAVSLLSATMTVDSELQFAPTSMTCFFKESQRHPLYEQKRERRAKNGSNIASILLET